MAQGIAKMCQFASPPAQNLTALRRSDFNTRHAGDAAWPSTWQIATAIVHLIKHNGVIQARKKGQGRTDVRSTL
jgi:hypothetical protein